jgi:hypothetical protein
MLPRMRSTPAPAASSPLGLTLTRTEDLVRVNGGNVESANGSNLEFGYGQGGLSRARFRTCPGAIWVASCNVHLANQGELLPCRFGAVMQDDAGSIVLWWHSPAIVFEDGEPMRLRFETRSPDDATWARLGIIGPRAENKRSTAVYKFTNCQLKLLSRAAERQEQA